MVRGDVRVAKFDEGEEMARVRVGKAALVPGWVRRHKGEESARRHEGGARYQAGWRILQGGRGSAKRGRGQGPPIQRDG